MIFDDNISEEVSIPKIIDYMITEGEKPSVIVNILKEYDNEMINDILDHSCFSSRIFNIDFVYDMSYNELMDYYKILKNINKISVKYLCWQIMQSDMKEEKKNIFRNLLNSSNTSTRHPHSGVTGNTIKLYDSIFLKERNILKICSLFNKMDIEKFSFYLSNIEHSLWICRLMNVDFLENLTPERQYIYLKNIYSSKIRFDEFSNNILRKLSYQILKSDLDDSYKIMIYNMDNTYMIFENCSRILKIINECDSYSELIMKVSLNGLDNLIEELIYYLTMIKSKKNCCLLNEMYESDKELIINNLNVCPIIESWRDSY